MKKLVIASFMLASLFSFSNTGSFLIKEIVDKPICKIKRYKKVTIIYDKDGNEVGRDVENIVVV